MLPSTIMGVGDGDPVSNFFSSRLSSAQGLAPQEQNGGGGEGGRGLK